MANYECSYRTNYFRVSDEEKYKKIISDFSAEDFHDFFENGKHCFGGYGRLFYEPSISVPAQEWPAVQKVYEAGKTLFDESGAIVEWDDLDMYNSLYDEEGDCIWENERGENDFDAFLSEIQSILPEGECFVYLESGHEKLRYVEGIAIVVTKNACKSISLSQYVDQTVKELLGSKAETKYAF